MAVMFSLVTPGPVVFGRVMPLPAQDSGAEPGRDNLASFTRPVLADTLPI